MVSQHLLVIPYLLSSRAHGCRRANSSSALSCPRALQQDHLWRSVCRCSLAWAAGSWALTLFAHSLLGAGGGLVCCGYGCRVLHCFSMSHHSHITLSLLGARGGVLTHRLFRRDMERRVNLLGLQDILLYLVAEPVQGPCASAPGIAVLLLGVSLDITNH